MENIVDILFEFIRITNIISAGLLSIGIISLVYGIMFSDTEKKKAALAFVFLGTITLAFSIYSNKVVNERIKLDLTEMKEKFVGKSVYFSGKTKKIKDIKYNKINKIEVSYNDGTYSETIKIDSTSFIIIITLMVMFIGTIYTVGTKLSS